MEVTGKLRTARSLGEAEDGELSGKTTNEDDKLFSVDNKEAEEMRSPEDENLTTKENFKVSRKEENNTTLKTDEDVLPKLTMLDSSTMNMSGDAVNEGSCEKSVSPGHLPTTSLAGKEDNDCVRGATNAISNYSDTKENALSPKQSSGVEGGAISTQQGESKISSTDDRENSSIATELDNAASFPGGAANLPEGVNSTKKKDIENFKGSKKDTETVLLRLKVADSSEMNTSRSDTKGNNCTVAGLSLELEDLKGKYQKMTKERNSLQQKIFEMQSEFCSVEIERDLEKETSRYLEEQILSLTSSLSLKENELESLRKRYKLLNEGFLNSETLREGLERDVAELTKVIGDLEERLQQSEGMLKDNLEVKTAELTAEKAEEKAKLETELATLNETLRKERSSKTNLEEMFTNIEKERSLLLNEVEDLRCEHQKEINEVNVLRDLLHDKNKQEQLNQLQEQHLQRQLEEKQKQQNKEVAELRESNIHLSSKISSLQHENKTLEDELYQQLTVLENLQAENKSLTGASKELGVISDKVKVLGVGSIEQLITGYSKLREDKQELERRVMQLKREISVCEISKEKVNSGGTFMDCPHLGENSTKSSCVPRSEYLKLKFQLKSSTEEIQTLKQALERKAMKEKAILSENKQERRSRKHENKMAKKWLNTMKDSMNAVVREDENFSHEQYGSVLLENQLHETKIRVDAFQHELEISKKENAVLNSVNTTRAEEIKVLKLRLVESQETQTSLLKDLKTKLGKAEKDLEDEVQKGIGMKEKIAYLEEQNQDMCIELEKLKEKSQFLQEEKEKAKNELESFKHDILKNFGSLNIESVSKSLTSVKEKSVEYVKIIEINKSNLVKLTQDLDSLQQVNTVLREELSEVRIQLQKKDEVISQKSFNESISEKRQSERLQAVMQALESSKQNEAELLAMYAKEKRELEKLHEELMSTNSELEETKILLLEKEKECERTSRIMRELEASCEVYEAEFEKSTRVQEQENLHQGLRENELPSDEGQEDELSESGSDTTAENFREIQEVLQERMAMKVKRLQDRLEETQAALSSCQQLNVDLQKRLHDVETKNLEKDEADGGTPDKEFIETILFKLSEKEKEIQEILQTNSLCPRDGKKENHGINLDELLSPYKETIKQLKIDNAKNDVRLVEAKERIAELEERLATYQNSQDDGTRVLDCSDNDVRIENASSPIASQEVLIGANIVVATNDNLKEELDCVTAKYINLKAAFEGCLKRLKTIEGDKDVGEEETAGTVNMVERFKSSDVIEGMVVPKFISPLQGKKTETAEVYTELQETTNFQNCRDIQAIRSSTFSEISCAFKESDSDADSIGSDCMVIELTFTENNLDLSETCDEFLHEKFEHENEFGRLRARIIELEKLNSKTLSEIHRVKQCSFKERTELENKLRSLEELNSKITAKLTAVEVEKDSLEERVILSDIRRSEAKQELQCVKISTSEEQEASKNTIKGLKNQENALKKQMVKLETEKDELRVKIEELQGQLQDCFQEAKRVKVEYYNQGENFRNVFNEFEREIDVHKKGKERYELRISELNQKVCVFEDEIRKSKEENLKQQESVGVVIMNLKKEITDLKCEKEDVFVKNRELEHRNEILTKKQEESMASILKEREDLRNTIIRLQTKVTTQEETLGREKVKNDDLTCKFRTENEESELRFLSQRKAFEDTTRQLQEKIVILENEIKDLNFRKDNLESIVKQLEEKNNFLSEENEQRLKALLDEKQNLEGSNEKLQIMITELKEKFMVENTENDNKISLILNENLFLKVESEKIESQVLKCVDEIQRIKSLSFNERQKWETTVINQQETVLSMKKEIDENKQAMEHLNLVRNDFEVKCVYLQKELERVKICSFKESELENKIEKLTGALSSIEVKFEDLKKEKDQLLLKEKESEEIIWRLQEELQRIKVHAFEERQNMLAKVENYNVLVKESKTNFEHQILRDKQISSLELKVSELDDLKRTLENDNYVQHKEICAFKINVENLQNEIKQLEKKVNDYEHQVSTLRRNLSELGEDKRSLETKVLQQDGEILSVKKMMEELQHEKKYLQQKIVEKDEQVSLLQMNVTSLEEQTENNMLQSSKEKSSAQILVTNLEKQKTLLKDDIVKCSSEIAFFKRKVSQFEEERESLATCIAEKDRELSEFGITVAKIEDENNHHRESIAKQNNEILLLGKKVSQLEEERENLTNSINVKAIEVSDFRVMLEKLENEKNTLKEDNVEKINEISSLGTTVAEIEKEKECLADVIAKQDDELSSFKITLEELSVIKISVQKHEEVNKFLEDVIVERESRISQQEADIALLEKEKEILTNDVAKKDEELSGMKATVETLQSEKEAIEENNFRQGNEISLLETTRIQLERKNESLKNDIGKRNEELFACKETIEKFEAQKKDFENDLMGRDSEILFLKELNVSKLQEEKDSFANQIGKLESRLAKLQNEKGSIMNDLLKNGEELSVLKTTVEELEHEKKVLAEDIMKRDGISSMQEANVERLEKEKQTLSDDLVEKDKELFCIKKDLEKLETERKCLEDSVVKKDDQILFLNDKISMLEDEKESLAKSTVEQLSNFKITVEELQNEKKATEDDILKRDSEILSLQSNMFNLQAENETLTNTVAEKNEKLSAYIENIEKLDYEKNSLQSLVMTEGEELLSLRNDINEITQVKTFLEADIQKRDEELSSLKETLHNLQDENKLLENDNVEHTEIISHYTMKIESYQEEISLLKSDLQKVTIEKENVENKMKEFREKSKSDEEDFDKLVAGYLQEIDSWKKSFGALEDEMSVLRNEIEKLQNEKQDLESIFVEMSESERVNEEKFQENIKIYHEDIDSWKAKLRGLESDAEILRKTVQELGCENESKTLEINRTNEEKEKNNKLYQDMVIQFQEEKENSEKQWVVEKEKEIGNLRFEFESKLQMMESQFSVKEKELHDRNISIEQLKDDVSQLNNVILKKDEEASHLKSKVKELNGSILETNNKIYEMQQEYDRKEQELKLSLVCVEELREETRKLTEIVSAKDEHVLTLENEIKELSKVNKELDESKLWFMEVQKNNEDELRNLQNTLKSYEAKELAAKEELKLMVSEVNNLRNELSALQQQNLEDANLEKTVNNSIEKGQEQLRVVLADIDETTKIKVSLEKELQLLQSKLEGHSEEKTKLEMEVFCLKEITEELTKGKMTLLEEIARLSDQKKEGQELLNSEFARLRNSNNELENNREKIEKENAELVVQISSLKVTLATVQSAYEQTQDEIKNHRTRLDEAGRREKQHNQEREKLEEKSKKIIMEIKTFEERNRSVTVENKELSLSLSEARKRLESLEKELQTIKGENALLSERLNQQESGDNTEGLDSGKQSTQASALRKKLKEFRGKLSEEKKQREMHEFEIKNLKEKVERMVKKEKESEVQLENNRKKFLEVKTERDGLLMDLDSLNKRKKKDLEGYTDKIEKLEDELRVLREKESQKADGKQTKETVNVLNEEKKILELRLTSNQERHQREVTELKTTLDSLQNRYTTELKRFETTEATNKNEILKLRKSLTSIEREHESRARELEQLRANLVVINAEKVKIEKVLSEKNSEVNKWKKEALNDKAEIKFLRGSLNILEKEGLANTPTETHKHETIE